VHQHRKELQVELNPIVSTVKESSNTVLAHDWRHEIFLPTRSEQAGNAASATCGDIELFGTPSLNVIQCKHGLCVKRFDAELDAGFRVDEREASLLWQPQDSTHPLEVAETMPDERRLSARLQGSRAAVYGGNPRSSDRQCRRAASPSPPSRR
jgi:hypothetical protein